jgi:hypothetical protein
VLQAKGVGFTVGRSVDHRVLAFFGLATARRHDRSALAGVEQVALTPWRQ